MDRVRRQHVVSRFYLNGFGNDMGRVRRVTLPGAPASVLSTKDASVIKDFYTVTLPDGTQSDIFEKAFAEIEGPASVALRSLLDGTWPISDHHREILATWIALQHLRAEDVRSSQGEMSAQLLRIVVGTAGKQALRELIEKAESRPVSDEELQREWADITKPGGPDLVPNVQHHLKIVMDLLPATAAYLYNCHWTLLTFARRSIITSDHPVSLVVDENHPEWSGVGIATAQLFLVPLSRRTALTIQPRDRFATLPPGITKVPDFHHPGTTQIANSINQETVMGARRYIYHHPDDTPLSRLHLPEPRPLSGASMSDASHLIHEDGLFRKQRKDRDKNPRQQANRQRKEKRGVSIQDIPWPIPGRRTPKQP